MRGQTTVVHTEPKREEEGRLKEDSRYYLLNLVSVKGVCQTEPLTPVFISPVFSLFRISFDMVFHTLTAPVQPITPVPHRVIESKDPYENLIKDKPLLTIYTRLFRALGVLCRSCETSWGRLYEPYTQGRV